VRLLVFCEATGDFRTVAGLVDRVIREEGPVWVREHLEFRPLDDLRQWIGEGGERSFFDVHHVYRHAAGRGIRLPHARFEGRPAGGHYLTARTAFLVARHEAKQSGPLDAVLFVVDADDQGPARRESLEQARALALREERFRVVIGCPDLEREAWVLAGFEPENAAERERLDGERSDLGFCPREEAHRLRDHSDHGKRSPKRVLAALTSADSEREERCWTDAPLERLRARGTGSGLRTFLDEVQGTIVPLFEAPPPAA
jgi:hypothetical protein